MIITDEISGYYGQGTPCQVFTGYDTQTGLTWYAVEGSQNVNAVPLELENGVDVETLPDVDMFTWPNGIHSESDLEQAINA